MNKTEKTLLKDYDKIFVQIKSKEDETKWKLFLKHYFPNHYASRLLGDDLVIDVDSKNAGRGYINKSVAVSTKGYGYITFKFADLGGYKEVNDFEEFKLTRCYENILAQGVTFDVGKPEIINLKGN